MKRTESAGGVVVRNGLVLVVNQRGISWSFPKGHVEKGEGKVEAAGREIHEESGITDLELVKELGSYQRYKMDKECGDDKSELKTISMFLFRTDQEELKPLDPKHPEAVWVRKDMVAGMLSHRKDREFYLSIADEI